MLSFSFVLEYGNCIFNITSKAYLRFFFLNEVFDASILYSIIEFDIVEFSDAAFSDENLLY